MKKFLLLTLFLISFVYSCSNAEAKEGKKKSNAFEKVDKRDKKLFTQEERINSYNKSKKKSESIKASLSANSHYNGYGSAKSIEKKESNKKNKIIKPKFSNAGFSAYSTN
jgi:PBP1b-binding outer membrane lipoprotein LpoB